MAFCDSWLSIGYRHHYRSVISSIPIALTVKGKKVLYSDCRRIRRLSPKTATVAEFGNSRRFWRQIVAEIGDYSLQCGQAIML